MLNCYVDWGSIDSVIQTVNLLITDRHLWTPSHDFTLPAPPENTWSTSRKCWRKTGSDGSLRSRNRGWGCSAASSPRWGLTHSAWHSSVFHDADPTASCADARLVCASRRERRVGMMRWRPSKGTWTASAETQRCTPLRHHRPRKQVGSPQSSDADGIPVISVSFYSDTFTLCECSEIFQQVPHHI